MNIAIALASYSISILLLVTASHATWPWAILCAVIFSFSNNTVFSLLHESVHRSFSKNRFINDLFGILSSAFFPTGYSLQRAFHLGHHRRNRTDAEMFDSYYKDDFKPLKFFQWYGILTGIYWMSVPLAAVIYLIAPWVFRLKFHKVGEQTGAEEMFASIETIKSPTLARAQIVYSFLFQVMLFQVFNLDFSRWLLCYGLFGMNWGALQYADHAWSERDIRNGAWNLKTSKLTRWIFLNYHLHLAHHQHPNVPWHELPRFVKDDDVRPSFLSIYISMWGGPRLTEEKAPKALDEAFIVELEGR